MLPQKNKKSVIAAYFIISLLLSAYLSTSLKIFSDMSFFLSSNSSYENRIIQQYLQGSDANRLLFIQLGQASDNTKELVFLSKQLSKALQENKHFNMVSNGQQSIKQSLAGKLYQYRYLISSQSDKEDAFSIASLKVQFMQLQQRLQMLISEDEQKIIAESPLNIWLNYLASINNTRLKNTQGVWFNHRDQAVLLIKTKTPGFAIEQQKKNIEFIKSQIQQLIPAQISYTLSGAAMIAVTNSEQIAFQVQVISILASCILAIFLLLVFRSFKVLVLLSLPLLFAVLVGSSTVNFFYGYIHGISLAFGITIIGIAVDYPLHYFSHLATMNHTPDFKNNHKVIVTIWPKLKLGLLTTLIGLSAITFSSFSGLNQLGLFAISGLIAALLVTRYVLPLFNYKELDFKQSDYKEPVYASLMNKLYYLRYPVLLLMAVAIAYIATHQQLWENDLARLSPVSKELKQQDFTLRKSLNLPELRYLILISAHSEQKVLQQIEALKPFLEKLIRSDSISYYDSAVNYIPSVKTQLQRQQKLPDQKQLVENLIAALADSPFNLEAFRPFINAVENNKRGNPLVPDDLKDSLIAAKINSMLFLDKKSAQWNSFIFLSGVQAERLKSAFKQYSQLQSVMNANTDKVQLIDLKQQSNSLIKAYRTEALQWFFGGSLLIVFFLFFYVKKIKLLPALILPFIGAVIFTISSLLLFGYSLSVFHLVTLLLVVGLAIDYSIFIYSYDKKYKQTATFFSVLVCMLSSFIMFFSLSLSSLPVLKAIGLTASLGASLAFILSLIFSRTDKSV